MMSEKLDGSNVCLESEAVFARSHASAPNHPSFDALKALHSGIKFRIPAGLQVFGEWLYAKHSIGYDKLPSHLMVFGVRDLTTNRWASWEEVEMWADELACPTVPVLERQVIVHSDAELQKLVEAHALLPSRVGEAREGIVVRRICDMADELFSNYVAKWVRKDHVQTDDHWKSQAIVKNGIV